MAQISPQPWPAGDVAGWVKVHLSRKGLRVWAVAPEGRDGRSVVVLVDDLDAARAALKPILPREDTPVGLVWQSPTALASAYAKQGGRAVVVRPVMRDRWRLRYVTARVKLGRLADFPVIPWKGGD